MPGFKGSSLQIENGPVIWPNLIRAHFNKRVSLGLHLPVVGLENPLSLVSRGVVESVGIIPPFLKQDVYGPFLQVLRETLPKELDIIHFHYDWRNELEEAVEDLRGLVNTLSQTHHGPIDIISHSMGGLITTRILQMTESD